MVEISSW